MVNLKPYKCVLALLTVQVFIGAVSAQSLMDEQEVYQNLHQLINAFTQSFFNHNGLMDFVGDRKSRVSSDLDGRIDVQK
jgi:hypothetical protein